MTGVTNAIDASVASHASAGMIEQEGAIGELMTSLTMGFKAAAAAAVLSFVTAPAYLVTLRRRDKAGADTSGVALRMVAQGVALVVFVALASLMLAGLVG